MTAKIDEYFPICIYNIRARFFRQSKLNEYIIIDKKVDDDHRSLAENHITHALSGQWPFGKSKLDLKQSSLKRARSSNLNLASWCAKLLAEVGYFSQTPHYCSCGQSKILTERIGFDFTETLCVLQSRLD
jgi:hypothetical protein